MNRELPSVTVVIPARPGQAEVKAVHACRNLDYPGDKLQIIVARGRQPSAQRNAALRQARGDLIYFLDDDSVPQRGNLLRGTAQFAEPTVKMLGGPNLCPPEAPWIEQVFALVLSSWLAFGPSRSRYCRIGHLRESSEKELILCNLLARRQDLLDLGGFDESLYPNEENALMDEIAKRGGKLLYSPDFFVHRRPRPNLRAFGKMLITYGRGRAEQFRRHPTPGSALNFIPPLFCVFLVLLPFLGLPGLISLGVYLTAVSLQTIALVVDGGIVRALAAMPLIVVTHVLYGLGFWGGLFTRIAAKRHGEPVEIEMA